MKNSKSDGWILRVVAAGNQYLGEGSRCGVELSAASPSGVASVWKLLQFISPPLPSEPWRRSSHIRTAALTKERVEVKEEEGVGEEGEVGEELSAGEKKLNTVRLHRRNMFCP